MSDQEIREAAKYECQQQASSRESSPSTLHQTNKPGHKKHIPSHPHGLLLMPHRHEGYEEGLDHALHRHKHQTLTITITCLLWVVGVMQCELRNEQNGMALQQIMATNWY